MAHIRAQWSGRKHPPPPLPQFSRADRKSLFEYHFSIYLSSAEAINVFFSLYRIGRAHLFFFLIVADSGRRILNGSAAVRAAAVVDSNVIRRYVDRIFHLLFFCRRDAHQCHRQQTDNKNKHPLVEAKWIIIS